MSAILETRGITKRFPGVVALNKISISIRKGSCHALVGENGAGKSTLGKILAGLYHAEEGQILLDGDPVYFATPLQAMRAGVGLVHQELAFCENLTVAENLCLDHLPSRMGFLDSAKMRSLASEWLAKVGAEIHPNEIVGSLPIGKQQLVQIAGALGKGSRVLIFDEPTSSLTQREASRLFDQIRALLQEGVTCIYVSHRLEEVFEICDTVTVLRDGEHVGTFPTTELTKDSLIQKMIGRELEAFKRVETTPGEEALRVQNLRKEGKFADVSLTVHRGEVVGLAGLVGSGRTEILEALFGIESAAGEVFVRGRRFENRSPSRAMKLGIGLVPEDRKRQGLVLSLSARENISLAALDSVAAGPWISSRQETSLVRAMFEKVRVKAPSLDAPTLDLSGGNQQKLVLAKWMAANSQILLLDEPTRGVDVGAKAEIYGIIRELVHAGGAVLLASSELPELLALSTRILVVKDGRIAGELPAEGATEEGLMRLMTGVA